ncbi:MAG: hypothetical protein Q9180_005653 [Flavoplaca navasiana]
MSGCSATGTTVYSTATANPCTKLTGWGEVEDGEDFEPNQSFGSAGIVQPSSSTSGFRLPSLPFASSFPTGASRSSTGESASSAIGSASASPTSSVPRPSLIPLSVPLSSNGPASATSSASASTAAAPLDVPGVNGVPGCTTVVSAPGTSAHCQCGANVLRPSKPNVTFISWKELGRNPGDPAVFLGVKITDKTTSQTFGADSADLDWDEPLNVDSKIGQLSVTPHPGNLLEKRGKVRSRAFVPPRAKPHHFTKDGPIKFSTGSQEWDTTSSQCSLGEWDGGDAGDLFEDLTFGDRLVPVRQADCEFDCSIPNEKKRTLARTRDRSPSPVEENLLQIRASEHCAAWETYAPKGVRYYQEWKDKTGEDVVLPCNFDDYFDFKPPIPKWVEPARQIRDTMTKEGLSIERSYYATMVTSPKQEAIADFSNTLSGTAGVFLANSNDRGGRPAKSTDVSKPPDERYLPDYRTDVTRYLGISLRWLGGYGRRRLCRPTRKEGKGIDETKADYSGIKAFFRRNIDTPATKEILDELFKGRHPTEILWWTPDDPNPDTNAFWALLGSPNGNGVQWFATENKVALKGKGIVKIKATMIPMSAEASEYQYTMWFLFE